ncbi:hypothetical protein EJB05_38171, partial [Eragrostis curvula]
MARRADSVVLTKPSPTSHEAAPSLHCQPQLTRVVISDGLQLAVVLNLAQISVNLTGGGSLNGPLSLFNSFKRPGHVSNAQHHQLQLTE